MTRIVLWAAAAAFWLGACQGGEAPAPTNAPRIEVEVGALGYDPATVEVEAGRQVVLVFTRTTDEGCGDELVIASLDIRRDLPLNQPVEVALTPRERGRVRFSCGMDMYDGTIVVTDPG